MGDTEKLGHFLFVALSCCQRLLLDWESCLNFMFILSKLAGTTDDLSI